MPDVGEPAFLGNSRVTLLERSRVGEQALLHSRDEDDAELESFDHVQRDERHALRVVAHGVDVADQGDVLEELHEAVGRRDIGVLTGKPCQLEHVGPAFVPLLRAVLEHLAVARLLEDALEQHRHRDALRIDAETLHERREAVQRGHRSGSDGIVASRSCAASSGLIPFLRASFSSSATLRSPIFRRGVFTTRAKETASRGFTQRRRYASTSLTSRRS